MANTRAYSTRFETENTETKTSVLNRITSLTLMALVLSICFFAYSIVSQFVNRPINAITMEGQNYFIDNVSVKQILEPHLSSGFLSVDLQQIKQDLERHPWVYSADVKRMWPRELVVDIVEHEPLVKWQKNGYLNAQGQPFFPQHEAKLDDLVQLDAPSGHHQKVLAAYQWLVPKLSEYGFGIDKLSMDAKGAMTLALSNKLLLKFGVDQYESKLQRFLLAYDSKLKLKQEKIEYVDLRYTNGLAVGWRDN